MFNPTLDLCCVTIVYKLKPLLRRAEFGSPLLFFVISHIPIFGDPNWMNTIEQQNDLPNAEKTKCNFSFSTN